MWQVWCKTEKTINSNQQSSNPIDKTMNKISLDGILDKTPIRGQDATHRIRPEVRFPHGSQLTVLQPCWLCRLLAGLAIYMKFKPNYLEGDVQICQDICPDQHFSTIYGIEPILVSNQRQLYTATVRPRRSGPRILYNTPLNLILTQGWFMRIRHPLC